jgi:1-deoxy-D-xylulose-5-phosphate reductoisomerase
MAVEAFLQGKIGFPEIAEIVEETLSRIPMRWPGTVAEVLEIDRESRVAAGELVMARTAGVVAR